MTAHYFGSRMTAVPVPTTTCLSELRCHLIQPVLLRSWTGADPGTRVPASSDPGPRQPDRLRFSAVIGSDPDRHL